MTDKNGNNELLTQKLAVQKKIDNFDVYMDWLQLHIGIRYDTEMVKIL